MFDILVRIQSTELSDIQYKSLKYTHDLMIANSLLPGCWSYIKNIIELPRNPVEILCFRALDSLPAYVLKYLVYQWKCLACLNIQPIILVQVQP